MYPRLPWETLCRGSGARGRDWLLPDWCCHLCVVMIAGGSHGSRLRGAALLRGAGGVHPCRSKMFHVKRASPASLGAIRMDSPKAGESILSQAQRKVIYYGQKLEPLVRPFRTKVAKRS